MVSFPDWLAVEVVNASAPFTPAEVAQLAQCWRTAQQAALDSIVDPAHVAELHQAAERELAMRRRVYVRRMAERKMTPAQAERETLAMLRIEQMLARLLAAQRPPLL